MDDRECVDAFLEFLVSERCVSENTSSSYGADLRALNSFLGSRKVRMVEATSGDLRGYVKFLHGGGYSVATIARRVAAARGLYGFLYSERIIDSDPSVDLESRKPARVLPKVLSVDEVARLLYAASLDSSAEGRRVNALVNVLYSSGVRVSELIRLSFYEVESMLRERSREVGHVVIEGKAGKERLVVLNQVAMESIRGYMEVRGAFIARKNAESRWLFPGARFDHCITRQRVGQLLKSLCDRAEVDFTRVSPHKIRHSFATHLLNNGSDIVFIQKMLGHSSLSTTQVYTHVACDRVRKVLSRVHPFATGQSEPE